MNTQKVKISEVKANPNNPRLIKDDKFKKLVKSIQEFPEMLSLRPIVVNADMIVLGGNMRLKACKEAGLKEVDIIKADDLTEEQQKQFIIKDNVGFGEWDWEDLANNWDTEQLTDWGLDIPDFKHEVLEAEEDDFEVPDGGIDTDIVLGDLFEIGEHRLLCGDSTDSDQVAKLMNGQKADMVFTDPPYYSKQNLVREATPKALIKGSLMGKDSMFAKIYDFDEDKVLAMLNTLYIYSKVNTYFCCSQEQVVFYLNYAEDIALKYNILVWRKPNNVINKDRFSSSIEYIIRIYDTENAGLNKIAKNEYYDKVKEISRYIQKDEKVHHTQKPIELVTQFVELSSLENNLLFEPFTGSGSTMVVAHQLKRKCYGMELDPKYCQVIVDRMMKLDPNLEVKRNGQKYTKTMG
jgi:DNA modification methylase